MDQVQIAEQLATTLSLQQPPVALAFVESVPAGIAALNEQVPSACAMWRKAEAQVFYAPAESHFNCPVGSMTMGFELPETVKSELMGLVGKMCECGYFSADEPAKMPTIKKRSQGIVYGPLKELPVQPDLILMWLTPRQAMFLNEASGAARWTDEPSSMFGRPGCAALPVALDSAKPATSFGCMGMRTFTEISDDRFLAVLPAARAEDFVQSLAAIAASNDTMRAFYEERKARFSG